MFITYDSDNNLINSISINFNHAKDFTYPSFLELSYTYTPNDLDN